MVLSSIIFDIRGVQKFKMAACKLEVLESQLVDEIKTQIFLHNSTKVSYICNTVIAKHYHRVLHVRYI